MILGIVENKDIFTVIVLIGIILVFFILISLWNKNSQKNLIDRLIASYGKSPNKSFDYEHYMCIPHYYEKHREGRFVVDDITWNDLEMDKIFSDINRTLSAAGEEYLYSVLRMPCFDESILKERNRLAEYIDTHDKQRGKIMSVLYRLSSTGRISLSAYLSGFLNVRVDMGIKRYLPFITFFAAIVTLCFHASFGMLALLLMLFINVPLYFREKAAIDSYFICTAYISRMVKAAIELSSMDISEMKEYMDNLHAASLPLKKLIRKSRFISDPRSVSGGLIETIMQYINIIFHLDLFMFYSSLKTVKSNIDNIEIIQENIGKIELALSMAAYRRRFDTYCKPEFSKNMELSFDEVYHPEIKDPVTNSLNVCGCVLLTGSNASGKSTFLKTIALNAVLAQTIYTCMAKKAVLPFMKVMSSMSLKDDLEGGDSYYMVEIKALKRIIDEAGKQEDIPVMCFVDEVLRGTNTVERIAASSEILKQFAASGSVCFAATHDIELTYILEDVFSNYHFNEDVKDNDVFFSYILHEGRATSRNAIRLLSIMGYSEEIIEKAEKRAEIFIETGEWK